MRNLQFQLRGMIAKIRNCASRESNAEPIEITGIVTLADGNDGFYH